MIFYFFFLILCTITFGYSVYYRMCNITIESEAWSTHWQASNFITQKNKKYTVFFGTAEQDPLQKFKDCSELKMEEKSL